MQTRRKFLKQLFVGAAVVAVAPSIIAELAKAEAAKPKRQVITFERLTVPVFTKDIDELWSYSMDIRDKLAEAVAADIQAEEDARLMQSVSAAMGIPYSMAASC